MKVLRKIIEIDDQLCNGCGQCVPDCAEGALAIVNGKARMIAEKYCDGLGACLGACPTGALTIIERPADDFDEKAVEALRRSKKQNTVTGRHQKTAGCPSSVLKSFQPQSPCQGANVPVMQAVGVMSALSQWPVQIRLVPPTAPFLQNADLLIAADCVPVAHGDFHNGLLRGRKVMIGCPKFDDGESYVQKFTELFANTPLKSVTVAIMEVPCCGGLAAIVKKALRDSGADLQVELVVIGVQGGIIRRENLTVGN